MVFISQKSRNLFLCLAMFITAILLQNFFNKFFRKFSITIKWHLDYLLPRFLFAPIIA